VGGDGLGVFEGAAVLQVRGDAGGPESVILKKPTIAIRAKFFSPPQTLPAIGSAVCPRAERG